jgi:hypothetical protein
VHELSQFVYCPRAGLIAYEAETQDEGVEGRPTDLSHLPEYSLINIEAAISRAVVILFILVSLGVVAVIAAGIAALAKNLWIYRVSQWALLGILIGCFYRIRILFVLLRRRRLALRTQAREPIFLGDGAYPIHWWELRAAGFSIRRLERILHDEELGINGRPWAILVRGTECIPVFRMCGENERVYPNHMVRVAGYCRLVEAAMNYDSPYGIVLLPRRLDAMAIPHTPQLKAKLQGAIEIAMHTVTLGRDPDEPTNKKVCINCPLGKPRKYVAGKSTNYFKTQPLDPYCVSAQGFNWHTPCGDRFKWIPPTLVALVSSENKPS